MTKDYVSSAQKLFNGLKQDVTSNSINSLTIVTSMSAGVSIIGLLTKTEPKFTTFGFAYFILLALIVFMANKVLNFIAKTKKYSINDIEYEKDIK